MSEAIRQQVSEFHIRHGIAGSTADAFPAWWLHRTYELDPRVAAAHSSVGAYDFGLDAFHIERDGAKGPTLHLIQAKFSESRTALQGAVRGFGRTVQVVAAMLRGERVDLPPQNPLLARLAACLQENPEELPALRLQFEIIHLSSDSRMVIERATESAKEKLSDLTQDAFPDRFVGFEFVGPEDMQQRSLPLTVPAPEASIRFHGTEVTLPDGRTKHLLGLSHLADLIRLYDTFGEALFERNVRMFLTKESKRGPGKHIRDSIRSICLPSKDRDPMAPEQFSLLHNGVAIHATKAARADGRVMLHGPSVLNGCQTIMNAHILVTASENRERMLHDEWEAILIPTRIVVTTDEALVRDVAISNNRQSSVRPSALRSNDTRQLRLAERFLAVGVFYERQQGAFQTLRGDSRKARLLEEKYPNSLEAPLTVEDLAKAVAVASDRPLTLASNTTSQFEGKTYEELFGEDRLVNLGLLVFLVNLLKTVSIVLKKDLQVSRLESLPKGSFVYPCTRVLAKWIAKRCPDLVEEFGTEILKRPSPGHPLRERVRRLMAAQNTGLQQHLFEIWWDKREERWHKATDMDRLDTCLRRLRLADVDVFHRLATAPPE